MLLCVCVFVLLFPNEQFVDPRGVQNNKRECNERKRARELHPKGVIGGPGLQKIMDKLLQRFAGWCPVCTCCGH